MADAAQPFAALQVVEFGQFIAVPYCAQLLADGGAHVIKVEPLEGDPTRALAPLAPGESRHFLTRNRGKHSLALNLRHPAATPVLDALLARADVVLTNLRPGLAAEVGLDYPALSARFPRVIVGNVTGFGEQGPDAGLAGMDLVRQARSGLMAAMGRIRDGLPIAGESPIADYMCAVLLAFGVATALYRREQTGTGSPVDVSLLLSALLLQNNLMVRVDSADAGRHSTYLEWLGQARSTGVPFPQQADRMPGSRPTAMTSLYYRTFATSDSVIAVASVSLGLRRRFMATLGLDDPALEGRVPEPELAAHYAQLQEAVEARLASRTTAEWQAAFNAAGIPASAFRFPLEMLEDPHVTANAMLNRFQHTALGPVTVLGAPLALANDGFRPATHTPPFRSESLAILRELGLAHPAIQDLDDSGVVGAAPDAPRVE